MLIRAFLCDNCGAAWESEGAAAGCCECDGIEGYQCTECEQTFFDTPDCRLCLATLVRSWDTGSMSGNEVAARILQELEK